MLEGNRNLQRGRKKKRHEKLKMKTTAFKLSVASYFSL